MVKCWQRVPSGSNAGKGSLVFQGCQRGPNNLRLTKAISLKQMYISPTNRSAHINKNIYIYFFVNFNPCDHVKE